MCASAVALASHLSLPGSQDLHHSKKSGHRSLIRQLESINRYTPPQSVSDQDTGTTSVIENPAVNPSHMHSPLATALDSVPSQLFPPAITRKPVPTAIQISKDSAQGHVSMGWRFLLSGNLQAAMAAYREALRHQPDSAKAYVGMGIALKSLGNVEQAQQAIRQALELDPTLSSALVHLGYLYVDGHVGPSDPETARRLFHQASQLGDPFASIALLELQSRSNSPF
jgi:cytochrome c-type biogenesis protein CcmH/NrfG